MTKKNQVYRSKRGMIVIQDLAVLALYERPDVEIDRRTGTPLIPGKKHECYGNGKHDGFTYCCNECNYYSECCRETQAVEQTALDNDSAIGRSWDEVRAEIYTPEEMEECDRRVAKICKKIDRRNKRHRRFR